VRFCGRRAPRQGKLSRFSGAQSQHLNERQIEPERMTGEDRADAENF
jgi:hypothetical protein